MLNKLFKYLRDSHESKTAVGAVRDANDFWVDQVYSSGALVAFPGCLFGNSSCILMF